MRLPPATFRVSLKLFRTLAVTQMPPVCILTLGMGLDRNVTVQEYRSRDKVTVSEHHPT